MKSIEELLKLERIRPKVIDAMNEVYFGYAGRAGGAISEHIENYERVKKKAVAIALEYFKNLVDGKYKVYSVKPKPGQEPEKRVDDCNLRRAFRTYPDFAEGMDAIKMVCLKDKEFAEKIISKVEKMKFTNEGYEIGRASCRERV